MFIKNSLSIVRFVFSEKKIKCQWLQRRAVFKNCSTVRTDYNQIVIYKPLENKIVVSVLKMIRTSKTMDLFFI